MTSYKTLLKKEISIFLKKYFPKSKILVSKGLKLEGYDFRLKESATIHFIIQKWPKECDSAANTVKQTKCVWYFEKFKKEFKKHFQKKFVILNCCENFSIYDDGEGYTVTLVSKKYA